MEIKEAFKYLETYQTFMSLEQIDFIMSLKKYFIKHKRLSERQQTALFEIRKYLDVIE